MVMVVVMVILMVLDLVIVLVLIFVSISVSVVVLILFNLDRDLYLESCLCSVFLFDFVMAIVSSPHFVALIRYLVRLSWRLKTLRGREILRLLGFEVLRLR